MTDCSTGDHDFKDGQCTVCLAPEIESFGVDVWVAATIYVPAKDQEEASRIIAEKYAGTRDNIKTYDLQSGFELILNDDDFMSPAITIYGLAADSELTPKAEGKAG